MASILPRPQCVKEKAFKYIFCKIVAILFSPEYANEFDSKWSLISLVSVNSTVSQTAGLVISWTADVIKTTLLDVQGLRRPLSDQLIDSCIISAYTWDPFIYMCIAKQGLI